MNAAESTCNQRTPWSKLGQRKEEEENSTTFARLNLIMFETHENAGAAKTLTRQPSHQSSKQQVCCRESCFTIILKTTEVMFFLGDKKNLKKSKKNSSIVLGKVSFKE